MFRFGRGAVDVAARIIEFDGEPRHLEPQAFDLLAYLIANRDRVIPKTELLDQIWGDQFVSESALTTRVKEVRQALGDDGTRQEVIRNFRGRGYRFVAEPERDGTDRSRPRRNDEPARSDPGPGAGQPTGRSNRSDQPARARRSVAGVENLLGREAELAAAEDLIGSSALVTLVGTGGVGKTTLAREIAGRVGVRFTDGAMVVRLAPIRDPHFVVHAFRRDTDLLEVGNDETDLVAAIADLDALIVIDNCEHVLDEVTRLVAAVVEVGGDVRLLATSRERLGVPNEQVLPVAPLDQEAARSLLLLRARLAQPTYSWQPEEEQAIAGLLQSVDRLPLAIEMAAARLPSIGAADLADLLSDRLDLLRSADRAVDERHRTLAGLIAWSEDLLDDDERRLLSTLSVFAGPVPVSDIAAVVGADPSELAVGPLAGLVDRSLVVADTLRPPTRYRIFETVRAVVSRRATSDQEERHARHIIGVLTEADRMLRTPDERQAAGRVDELVAEIRVAQRWALEHAPELGAELIASLLHYSHERQWTEPAAWGKELMARLDTDDPAVLGVHAALGADASNRGDYQLAERHSGRAIASDDIRVASSAHDTLANIGLYLGDLDAASHHGAMLSRMAERNSDSVVDTLGLLSQVLAQVYAGRPDVGARLLDTRARNLTISPTSEAWLAYARGEVLAACDREHESIDWFERAIGLGSSVGSRFVVSVSQLSALAARTRSGDIDEALAAFVPMLIHYRRVRSTTHTITALRNLVELLVRAGRDEAAMVLLGALSDPGIKSTYGAESARLERARETIIARVGAGQVDSWLGRGAVNDAFWALDYAIEVLDG